ncbi:hypothetical protein EW146_g535 [Bondarzewia mesenterica]|uniref:Uncharacterized protein n=1 Tax=Bondarzewia mesenterica TaxID=1095465 RepID=A0A4S4MCU4_9AGAM|nr:hypothetical protein EW146_g535 [Bondarzewia mesenterica]
MLRYLASSSSTRLRLDGTVTSLLACQSKPLETHNWKQQWHRCYVASADILPQYHHPTRIITSLDPNNLKPSNYFDFSGLNSPNLHVSVPDEEGQPTVTTHPVLLTAFPGYVPFPPGTHGFLYYSAPADESGTGQIRFRITKDPNPSSFVEGHDLTDPSGVPWCLAPQLLRSPSSHSLIQLLVKQNLIPKDSIRPRKTMERSIARLGENFLVDFSRGTYRLYIQQNAVRLRHPLVWPRTFRSDYEGNALCCFERSPAPEDRYMLVMRLVKVLEPVTLRAGKKNLGYLVPEEGHLFMGKSGELYKLKATGSGRYQAILRALFSAESYGAESGEK